MVYFQHICMVAIHLETKYSKNKLCTNVKS